MKALGIWLVPLLPLLAAAQTYTPPPLSSLPRTFARDFLRDEKFIWTRPLHITRKQVLWLVPLAGATAALIATDKESSAALPNTSPQVHAAGLASTVGLSAAGALASGLFLAGRLFHDKHAEEAGFLSAEAAAEAGLFDQVLKLATRRERPDQGDQAGHFWAGGRSFPSGHASLSWAVAEVVASEYHNRPAVRFGAYGLAAVTSLSRFPANKHFLSDMLVGSAAGYLIGRHVYRARHGRDQNLSVAPVLSIQGHAYGFALSWHWQ